MRLAGPLAAVLLALPSCLDPLTSDTVGRPELILPPGTEVLDLEDNPDLAERIEKEDAIEGPVVKAHVGFLNGQSVRYWDFGPASPLPITLYNIVREDPQGFFQAGGRHWMPVEEAHPIIDKVPGDAGYSPWWTITLLPVTDAYDGEVIVSFDAVNEAIRQGLLQPPLMTGLVVNCPVIADDITLERTPGEPPEEPTTAYYRGTKVYYFGFGAFPANGPEVPVSTVYQIQREGGEPLSEPLRGVDMTGDGDLFDTNDVFALGPGGSGYSGMARLVDVVVTADTKAIDTNRDETKSDVTSIDDLFTKSGGDLVPDTRRVVAVHGDGAILNRPIAESSP